MLIPKRGTPMNKFKVGEQVFLHTGVTNRYLSVWIVSIDGDVVWTMLRDEMSGMDMAEFGSALEDVLTEMPLNGKILSEED